jgi:UDP-glucuronate 4-epimerase
LFVPADLADRAAGAELLAAKRRFATVSCPGARAGGRPSISSPHTFVDADREGFPRGRPIELLNHGGPRRDSSIDGVTRVVTKLVDLVPTDDPDAGNAPAGVDGVGNHRPEYLMRVVALPEKEPGRTAGGDAADAAGDVWETFADARDVMHDPGFSPSIPIEDGVRKFIVRYREHYKV